MWKNAPQSRVGDCTVGEFRLAAFSSGVPMLKRLGDEDAKAVDLLMDRAASIGQTTMYAVPGNDGLNSRVRTVESLLSLLKEMPTEDPPADLADRTLQRIEQRVYQAPTPVPPAQHLNPRPHA